MTTDQLPQVEPPLTRREFYAAHALTGVLAKYAARDPHAWISGDAVSQEAFEIADAMVRQARRT